MENLLELFPNLVHYLELLPVTIVALLAGVVSFYNNESDDKPKSKGYMFKVIGTSAFLGLIAYSLLSATDLPYLAKIGVCACIGFFGIDRSIELIQKLLSLRNGGGQTDKEKNAELKEALEKINKKEAETKNTKE